jgi:putative peptidoglycan lipid II flippase
VVSQLAANLLLQLLVIRVSGVSWETDAYIAAQAVPSVVGAVAITALQSVWLSRLVIIKNDVSRFNSEQSIALGQGGVLAGGLFLLVGGGLPFWFAWLFPGFAQEQAQTAIVFCYLFLFGTIFNVQSAVLSVTLRVRDRYVVAEGMTLIFTCISLIGMYFLLPSFGIIGAVWITLFRSIAIYLGLMALTNWPSLSLIQGWRCGEAWRLMRPLLFSTTIHKANPILDKYWASQAASGMITILTLAQAAVTSLATVFERVICMPIVPRLANYVAQNDNANIRQVYRRVLLVTTIIVVGILCMLLLLESQLIQILNTILKIQVEQAQMILLFVMLLSGQLHVAISGGVLVAIFYAFKDTRTPALVSVFGFIFGFFLKWALFQKVDVAGLAIASSVHALLYVLAFVILVEWRLSK